MTPSSRFVLGIDTAARLGSIALAMDGSAVVWESLPPGEHSSGISLAGERILKSRSLGWGELAGIAVSEGPGSFTGLRIGLAWAKGICMGSGVKLALVSEHEASAWIHRLEAAVIATVLPGERGHAQAALWAGGEALRLLWGPESVPEMEAWEVLRAHRPAVISGPGLKPEALEMIRDSGLRLVGPGDKPAATAVAELGDAKLLAGEFADLALAAPSYGRAPNARKPAR
ncbi:MAG TPA: tRNA (adenosine(37)-N6)-threonylcarbamoyltransferase complex dimerization subunit type 1 TsaB [Candidatus Limnocylindrales bacterium]|nr:tRNA (adenosine(37)-N6)-threonylcarbamoyltransferase complex dimerization subunit type 1 TsaB [Candidatus Limnocylindrales bacterium]